MSESMVSFPEDAASTQDSMAQVSVGTMLRKVREAQGLHIAALAVSLKVPVKNWMRLKQTDLTCCRTWFLFVRWFAAFVEL